MHSAYQGFVAARSALLREEQHRLADLKRASASRQERPMDQCSSKPSGGHGAKKERNILADLRSAR
jgi:hypothetical protein